MDELFQQTALMPSRRRFENTNVTLPEENHTTSRRRQRPPPEALETTLNAPVIFPRRDPPSTLSASHAPPPQAPPAPPRPFQSRKPKRTNHSIQPSSMDAMSIALHHERLAPKDPPPQPPPAPPVVDRRRSVTMNRTTPSFRGLSQPYEPKVAAGELKPPPLHHRPRTDAQPRQHAFDPTFSRVHASSKLGMSLETTGAPARPSNDTSEEVVKWMPLIQSGTYMHVPVTMAPSTEVHKPRDERLVSAGVPVQSQQEENGDDDDARLVRTVVPGGAPQEENSVFAGDGILSEYDSPSLVPDPALVVATETGAPKALDRSVIFGNNTASLMYAPINDDARIIEKEVSAPAHDRGSAVAAGSARATSWKIPKAVTDAEWQPPAAVKHPSAAAPLRPEGAMSSNAVPLENIHYHDSIRALPLKDAQERPSREVTLGGSMVRRTMPTTMQTPTQFVVQHMSKEEETATIPTVLFAEEVTVSEDDMFPLPDFMIEKSASAGQRETRRRHAAPASIRSLDRP